MSELREAGDQESDAQEDGKDTKLGGSQGAEVPQLSCRKLKAGRAHGQVIICFVRGIG